MTLSTWKCDRCGATQDFPGNEQPLAYFICTDSNHPRGPMCGGTFKPTYDGKPGSPPSGGSEHGA